MAANAMDRNERLLDRVVRERSGRGQRLSARTGWLVLGIVVVVLAPAAAAVRVVGSFAVAPAPSTTYRAEVDSFGAPPEAPAVVARIAAVPVEASAGEAATSPGPRPFRYTVQSGDSLQSIAARNGLRPATLAAVNDVNDPDLLQPGRTLLVPASDGLVHVVERGETLRAIAEQYGLDVATLVSANQLSDPDHIAVGLRLFIPRGSTGY
jgi:LysM repeat protein